MDELTRRRLHQLARTYARPGPRYTSYPTAADFGPLAPAVVEQQLAQARKQLDDPWSVYVHVPFCAQRCSFCACSVVATPEVQRVSAPYVQRLVREIELWGRRLGARRQLAQLHLGGGTPTYLSPTLLRRVFEALEREFTPTPDCERSIELDARATTPEHVDLFAELRIDRVSLGVQDLDPEVQRQIGREQSLLRISEVTRACRQVGVRGVNFDLVYGLPAQTEASMLRTIDAVVELRPDRLALYGYAHVPWMPGRGNQKKIDEALLPDPSERVDLFLAARERLLDAGYQAIGMDHFSLPDDPLALADAEGRLRRNFMGYTVSAGTDLLGFGTTAIGEIAGAFVQNDSKLKGWSDAIDRGELATTRGIVRTPDDELRAAVIEALMCRHVVEREEIERRFAVDFDGCFAQELSELSPMIVDGLLIDTGAQLQVTEVGRLFVRNLALPFDARTRARARPQPTLTQLRPRFSATV